MGIFVSGTRLENVAIAGDSPLHEASISESVS